MQDNLVRRILHIWFRFWLRAISLWLSTDNGHHCESLTLTQALTEKQKVLRCTVYFLVQIQFTGQQDHQINPILYFYYVGSVKIRVIWNMISEFVRDAYVTLVKPAAHGLFPVKPWRGLDDFNMESIMCCLTQRVIWQFCCTIFKI